MALTPTFTARSSQFDLRRTLHRSPWCGSSLARETLVPRSTSASSINCSAESKQSAERPKRSDGVIAKEMV